MASCLRNLDPFVWMPGSNGHSRTDTQQLQWPKETAGPDTFVQMAIVYQQQNITLYRNGELYASYVTEGQPHAYGGNTAVVFGQRHLVKGVDYLFGRIRDSSGLRSAARSGDDSQDAAGGAGGTVRTLGLVGFFPDWNLRSSRTI